MYKVTIRSKTRRKLFSNKEYQPTAEERFDRQDDDLYDELYFDDSPY